HSDPEVTILYTLDGSEPDINNLDGVTYQYKNSFPWYPENPFGEMLENSYQTLVYDQPINIYDRSADKDYFSHISSTADFEPNYFPENPIAKGTVVRAKVFKPGALDSPTLSHSYFVFPEGRARYSLPVVSVQIQENYLFDYYDGTYTAGTDFDAWRTANPDPVTNGLEPANWSRKGNAWEYPGNVEFFYPDQQEAVINQRVGTRIHGNLSASYRNKSMRLYARDVYGKSTFDYSFFPDKPYPSYKRLILRNSGQDYESTYVKDASLHEAVRDLNFDTQAYSPAVTFLNGEYWGILNIRERFDKHYLARMYGVDSENLDLIESGSEVDEGDLVAYNALVAFAQNNDLNIEANYDHISTLMDIDNFLDYYIAEIYIANRDWPGSNIKCWRLRTDGYQSDAQLGHDGRFRWFFYDVDFAFTPEEIVDFNTLQRAIEHSCNSSQIFAALLENESVKNRFVTRFADLINTTFVPSRIIGIVDRNIERIAPEITEHIARWKKPPNISYWNANIDVFHTFAKQRPAHQRNHLREFFDLGEDLQVTVEIPNIYQGGFKINTVDVHPEIQDDNLAYTWTGTYFSGMPLRIEAKPKQGYKFSHWEGDIESDEPVLSLTPSGDLNLTAHFELDPDAWVRIIHYWHFNDLPGDELESVETDYSVD
ncbi:MAG: CotH kinase family protein, partial [Candidatus Cloacimonadaceae bacterium]